jgi:hypothetical protein
LVFTVTTIAGTIEKKYKRAIKSEVDSREYFEDLSTVPTDEQKKLWEAEISKAEELRTNKPEAMDVMAPRIPKGKLNLSTTFIRLTYSSTHIGRQATRVVTTAGARNGRRSCLDNSWSKA